MYCQRKNGLQNNCRDVSRLVISTNIRTCRHPMFSRSTRTQEHRANTCNQTGARTVSHICDEIPSSCSVLRVIRRTLPRDTQSHKDHRDKHSRIVHPSCPPWLFQQHSTLGTNSTGLALWRTAYMSTWGCQQGSRRRRERNVEIFSSVVAVCRVTVCGGCNAKVWEVRNKAAHRVCVCATPHTTQLRWLVWRNAS